MKMIDLQKQRFKHLLANAILELWKKETGSTSSVLIEGTICISSGAGKTTVIQVADHFMGVLNDSANGKLTPSRTTPIYESPLEFYGAKSSAADQLKHDSGAFFSDAESDLNVTDEPEDSSRDVNGNDYEMLDKNNEKPTSPPPSVSIQQPLPIGSSTPNVHTSLMDLRSREEIDLSLSSPANYTSQVRDAIKNDYLSQRPVSTPPMPPTFQSPWFLTHSSHHHQQALANVHMLAAAAAAATMQPPPSKKRALSSSPFTQYEQILNHVAVSKEKNGKSNTTLSTSSTNSANEDSEKKSYKCEYCNKKFMFKSKYNEHLPVHTNERPFQCHLCSRTYKYKYDLQVHLRTHMGIPTKSTICPFCQMKFDSNKLLRQHIHTEHRGSAMPNSPSIDELNENEHDTDSNK